MGDINSAQILFNILIGGAGIVGGFVLNAIWQSLKELRENDSKLTDKVAGIEVLVAGSYVKRDEFRALIDALFKKLDHIEEKVEVKIDSKLDKSSCHHYMNKGQ